MSEDGSWKDAAKDWFSDGKEGFENRVIGTVATWLVGLIVGIWLEVWTLFFAAVDELMKLPRRLFADYNALWWELVLAFGRVLGAYESVLQTMVAAAGPFGWLAGAFAVTASLVFVALVLRLLIRVIPVL